VVVERAGKIAEQNGDHSEISIGVSPSPAPARFARQRLPASVSAFLGVLFASVVNQFFN
jgi:hypothetical protein